MTRQYEDFTLTLSGTPAAYWLSARGERGLVALNESVTSTSLVEPSMVAALQTIRAGYAPSAAEMAALGTALYETLFPPAILTVWERAQAYAEEAQREVRLRLEVVSDDFAGLPWELLYDPKSHLFLMPRVRFSLVRGVARAGVAVRPLRADGQATILRLVANPLDRVALEAGQDDWLTPLWQARGNVITVHAVTVQALQQALLHHSPHILHFDGHGGWDEAKGDGYIVLEDGQGGSVELSGSSLFTLLDGSSVRLVVLAACKSGQAGAIKQLAGVAQRLMSGGALPAVVAMQYDVPDSAALRFAQTLYQALALGQPLDSAISEGRKILLLERGEADSAWATPVLYLRAAQGDLFVPTVARKVPFQAAALSASDVPRKGLLATAYQRLIDPATGQGQPLTLGIHGAGGYGKSSFARVLCHDPAIQAAFPDGVLWVQVGQQSGTDERTWELSLVGKVLNWVEALGGERGSVTDLPSATDRLNKTLGEQRCLLVIDNVWQRNDATPFLQGIHCAKVITARNTTAFPNDAVRLPIAGMTDAEGSALLGYGLPTATPAEQGRLSQLVKRLGEYPLLLGLVNRTLVERVVAEQSSINEALTYVEEALTQWGVTAFDDQERAVQAVLRISLDQLSADELKRLTELAIFPEDTPIPIAVVTKLWQRTGALAPIAADRLLSRLSQLSLLLSLDRRPEHQSLQLHDVVRAYLLEPLDTAAQQQLHQQVVASMGAWQQWKTTERYPWQWLSYHLQVAGEQDALYALVTDPAFRIAQQTALGDIRVALTDIQRALSFALQAGQIHRTIRLVRTYRELARTEQVSDDLFAALDRYQWEVALQFAASYGTPPRLFNSWTVVLYLLIGFEAALAGAWQMAEATTQSALAFHRPPNFPLQRIVDGLHRRIAMTLGQQLADGLDTQGWVARLGTTLADGAPPLVQAVAAQAQLERSALRLTMFRQGLVTGEAEAVSSYAFADEERTAGESAGLGYELAQVADHAEGQMLIQETLDAVLLNRYPFYRDIALGAMSMALFAIPDGSVISRLVRKLLSTVLNDEGVTFEWELPHQLLVMAAARGISVPSQFHQLIGLASNTQDKWGTHWRVRLAFAATEYYQGRNAGALAMLNGVAAEAPDALYAGFSVLQLLYLHNRYLEFRQPAPLYLQTKAEIQSGYIQDKFTLAPARMRLVQAAVQQVKQGDVPTVAQVEQWLKEEEDAEVQRFYADYALAKWLAAVPPHLEPLQAILPRLLDKHGTLVDLYLARWVALAGNTMSDYEVIATLAMMDQYINLPPLGSEFG